MAGQPKQSGVKTSVDPKRETAKEIQAKLLHGHRDWRIVRLRQRIEASRKAQASKHKAMLQGEQEAELREWEAMPPRNRERCKRRHEERVRKFAEALKQAHEGFGKLHDNYLSARAVANAGQKKYVKLDEIDSLWKTLSAQFERAVLDGNADWFKRQVKALHSGDTRSATDRARDGFEAAVAREFERSFWETRAKERKHDPDIEAVTLEPAGKRPGVTAQQVLDRLEQRREGRYLFVEGCRFSSARRAREAIKKLAQLFSYELTN